METIKGLFSAGPGMEGRIDETFPREPDGELFPIIVQTELASQVRELLRASNLSANAVINDLLSVGLKHLEELRMSNEPTSAEDNPQIDVEG